MLPWPVAYFTQESANIAPGKRSNGTISGMKDNPVPQKPASKTASTGEASRLYEQIYACIAQVPPGYVTTYGAIGKIVGCQARVVGYALHFLSLIDRPEIPWQRVVNARGGVSTHGDEQRRRLEAEGIEFDAKGLIDLQRFGWQFPEDSPGSLDLSDLAEL